MSKKRISIKFAGASGQGINTTGLLLAKALNKEGYKIFAYREYPSLITGGTASYQLDVSNSQINSSSRYSDILLCFTAESLDKYFDNIKENGILVYDFKNYSFSQEQETVLLKKNITKIYIDSKSIATDAGGTEIMSNVVMLGFLWKILTLETDILIDVVLDFLKNKNIDLEAEKNAILAGYNSPSYRPELSKKFDLPQTDMFSQKSLIMTGNHGISLGAVAGGVRAYYAYPMTPATSIFKFLGDTSEETKILVKQAENEITAVQMAMGSMYMGTRALVGTSGGGFDLMIETISCAGISETPLVIFLSQRTGAGTGLPTWTGAGDLNTAVKGGHGDFPHCVIATSDAISGYTLIQEAFNIAETYQIPVIVLSEKQISESLFSVKSLPKESEIMRGLSEGENRYELTESGISPRWVPSKEKKPYIHNSDEHTEDGTSTEESNDTLLMAEKRMRKLSLLEEHLPEPKLYGKSTPEVLFVGWGSVKNTVLDVIEDRNDISYLHYEYVHPLKTKTLEDFIEKGTRIVLLENNQTGQFGSLIAQEIGYIFKERLLKYDGRPFFVEDILDFLNN
jgi:2-oxoglutarate ferredoxin oxidoreductase subunit alpha